ncbi:glycosyltransferase family A protein, partial [Haloferax sp. KTX1]|uniref:glycosyltransferase family 2 protein n=1 Tax=Haloferax sp. KTX1 TaxID=2600597 RepID=UPI0011DD22FD
MIINKYTFTVVIPVHNKRPHIARAIESALAQTFEDFELILIDDASTDRSSEVLEKYKDPRIRLFKRDSAGGGGYAARNLGIREACSEWVAFLDADDEWFEGHLNDLYELAEEYPQSSMLCSSWLIGTQSEKNINSFSRSRKGSQIFSPKEYLELQADGWDVVNTNVVAVRRTQLLR